MLFPDAFKKVFISDATIASTGTSADLTAGKIGLYDFKDHSVITAAPSAGNQVFYIAQGSFHTNDKIGPFHGGYKESIKSKGVNPKYVSRFFKQTAQTPLNQILTLGWDKTVGGAQSPDFECGKSYSLRIDAKGSAVLRFLNHQLYHTFLAQGGCCANDCSAGCTGALVDPAFILLQWADAINSHPIVSQFVQAAVFTKKVDNTPLQVTSDTYVALTDPTAIAALVTGLQLTTAYADTKFGNCSFQPTDHYELEPIFIYPSLVDETGEPCAATPSLPITEIQGAKQASGVGETVIRELILFLRYLQEPFQNDARLREVLNDTSLTSGIDRTTGQYGALYDKYCILHNVPRLNNATSIFDNDQYLLTIVVPHGADMSAFTTLIGHILDLAGNGVTLETY
jgi:hypothetical protein